MTTALDPHLDLSRDIYSVARLASEVRAVLDGSFPLLWVRGEISNLAQPASGHLYFSLKDSHAQVRCAMFRAKRLLLTFRPANGQQVLVRARATLYEPRGDFQLVVDYLEPDGEGALRLAFEELKRQLAAEGLFDEAAKRPLPVFPRQVGLITSPSGAAVRDLLAVLGRRFRGLPVIIYPAQVQGEGAAETLIEALTLANARVECDVLILARGGGALEDLNAFNDAALARAIRASAIPVVSGIGHEIDLTIADLAADRRAPTPSAAAELVAPSAEHVRHRLNALQARLVDLEQRQLTLAGQRLTAAARHLTLLHPRTRLQQQMQRLDLLRQRLDALMAERLTAAQSRFAPWLRRLAMQSPERHLERTRARLALLQTRLARAQQQALEQRRERLLRTLAGLDALSPLATLARGYAIVTTLPDGEIVRAPRQTPAGSRIQIRIAEGTLTAVVEAQNQPGRSGSG